MKRTEIDTADGTLQSKVCITVYPKTSPELRDAIIAVITPCEEMAMASTWCTPANLRAIAAACVEAADEMEKEKQG